MKNWQLGVPFFGRSGILYIVVYVNGILHAKGKVGPMGGFKEKVLPSGVLFTYVICYIT